MRYTHHLYGWQWFGVLGAITPEQCKQSHFLKIEQLLEMGVVTNNAKTAGDAVSVRGFGKILQDLAAQGRVSPKDETTVLTPGIAQGGNGIGQ